MIDREALAAALADYDLVGGYRLDTAQVDELANAARYWLDRTAKCGTCDGTGLGQSWGVVICPTCHGSGTVYS